MTLVRARALKILPWKSRVPFVQHDILKARRNLQLLGLIWLERGGNYSSIRTRVQCARLAGATDIPRRRKSMGPHFARTSPLARVPRIIPSQSTITTR
jgi:hypothetical protein